MKWEIKEKKALPLYIPWSEWKRKFLFFPVEINGYWRWLCFVEYREEAILEWTCSTDSDGYGGAMYQCYEYNTEYRECEKKQSPTTRDRAE